MSVHGWDSTELRDRLLLHLGRGNGGVMQYDELWNAARVWQVLGDGNEMVFADVSPVVPLIFVGDPVQLKTTDGGVTYDFPTWPTGHVEVYAQENGGRVLRGSSYGNLAGDFVFEGDKLRMPGDRARTFSGGAPWARFCGFPPRMSDTVQPTLKPYAARELILYASMLKASDVPGAQLDAAPWEKRYSQALTRYFTSWQTQAAAPQAGEWSLDRAWWLNLSNFNGFVGT